MKEIDLRQLKKVEIEDRGVLSPVFNACANGLCDYSFANLYNWGEVFDIRWMFSGNILVMHSGRDDLLFMPLGAGVGVDELVRISDEFRRQGRSGNYALVSDGFVKDNPSLRDHFRSEADEENANYVYLSRKLYELRGRKLQKKKNLLSQFSRNNPGYICRELNKGDLEECFTLAEKWCTDKTCEQFGFTHEKFALARAFGKFDELGLGGRIIVSGGKTVAFSVFSGDRDSIALVHFEKYDLKVKGSAQAINWETARHLMGTCDFVNREQDLGLEGLRRAKRSYCPEFMIEAYNLYRNGTSGERKS